MIHQLKQAYDQIYQPTFWYEENHDKPKTLTETYLAVIENKTLDAPLQYENDIFKAITQSNVAGLHSGASTGAGYSSVGAGDIQASYKGKPFNVEVKLSANEQMGGTSLRYDYKTKQFSPVASELRAEDLDLILKAAETKIEDIDQYIEAAHKLRPTSFHQNIQGIPLKISKEGRDKLKKQGLLAAINSTVESTTDFIVQHYNKKGVFYIQIGGKGLFYMGKNPLNLPIPPLDGKIKIEIRLGFSGGGAPFPTVPPTPARSANLRAQGRLVTKSSSPYSLDNAQSIRNMFSATQK